MLMTTISCGPPKTTIDGKPRPILLRDRNRETFDITHAVVHYKMNRHLFEHGIGKRAFPLIENNDLAEAAPDQRRDRVIGTQINGDTRSYSIKDVVSYEIFNETIGDTQAAVAY